MLPFIFAYISADIVRVLEIGYADERFLRRIAEIGHGILAGSYIQETVIVDRKFGIGEWLGYRFFMFEYQNYARVAVPRRRGTPVAFFELLIFPTSILLLVFCLFIIYFLCLIELMRFIPIRIFNK